MRNSLGVLNIYFKALGWSLFALWLGGGALFLSIWFTFHENIWWAVIIGLLFFCGFLYMLVKYIGLWNIWQDVFSRRAKLMGRVSAKWVTAKSEQGYAFTDYYIAVNDRSFTVSRRLYGWLSQGDDVVVDYWPHSRTVAWVEKLKE